MNEKIEFLAKRYYDFILMYRIVNGEEPQKNSNNLLEQMSRYYCERYIPWYDLTKGKELEELIEIFSSNNEKLKRYKSAKDLLDQNFYESAIEELEEYNKSKNISVETDEIIDELESYIENRSIDKSKFSEYTLQTFNLLLIINSIVDDIEKLYSNEKDISL